MASLIRRDRPRPPGERRAHGVERAGTIQSLDRGLAVLDLVAEAGRPLSVSDMAVALHVSLPTASRLAATLRERGLLRQDARGGRYSLGLGLARYAQGALHGHPLETASAGVLEGLLRDLEDTVSLGVPSPGGVLYIRSLAPDDRVFRILIPAGKVLPYHVTASGKVLLAFGPAGRVQDVMARGLVRRTRRSITEPDRLHAALERVREQGYALDRGESDANVACVAVPVFGRTSLEAALSCSMPRSDLSPRRAEQARQALVRAAQQIEGAFSRLREGSRV